MPKVLVVDDNRVIRKLAQAIFQQYDIECEEASNSCEAISLAEQKSFDLIILDVLLGEATTGFDLCRTFKKSEKSSKIVMMTSLTESESAEIGKDSGADGYFQKPIIPKEFMAMVNGILNRGCDYTADYNHVY